MTTYEYKCDACNKTQDRYFKFGEAPQKTPCECGAEMRKVFGSTPVIFRGSGWGGKGSIT